MLDFLPLLEVRRILQLKFEMGQDAEQRVIDFVSGTQSELSQRRVLLILGELRLKLRLLLIEFAFFVKTPEKLFLRQISLMLALLKERPRLVEIAREPAGVLVAHTPEHEHHGCSRHCERQNVYCQPALPRIG